MVITIQEIIEIEYKMLVEQDVFYHILDDYKDKIHHDYIQTNHYLTNDELKEKKYMLRIRVKDDSYEMTLKRPYLAHSLETNINISKEEMNTVLNGNISDNEIITILKDEGIDVHLLKNEISLSTHRYDIVLKEGTLSLDVNTYNGITDYEIEFEVLNEKEGYNQFLNIIKPYHLTYIKNNKSKIKRALDSL